MDTPIGRLPAAGSLDLTGLKLTDAALEELLRVDIEGWSNELPVMKQHFERFGARLPKGLRDELSALEQRLASANATA